jgi:hypothetical protein
MMFLSLKKSQSRQTQNFQSRTILISLGQYSLNNFQLSLSLSLEIHGLSLDIETMPMNVLVSVLTLRPVQKKSRSQS